MSDDVTTAIIAFLAVVVGGALTTALGLIPSFLQRHKNKAEADSAIAEAAGSLIKPYREEVELLRTELLELRGLKARVVQLEEVNTELLKRVEQLERENRELKEENVRLRVRLTELGNGG